MYNSHPSSLAAVVCAPLTSCCPKYIRNPVVLSSLKIWKQFRQHFKLPPTQCSPICNDYLFPPSNLDTVFTLWRERGLARFSALYLEGSFATFNDLCVKYNLPQSHLFRYFQAHNYACTYFTSFPQLPEGSLVIEVFALPKVPAMISILYDLISSSGVASLAGVRGNWEKELELDVTDKWLEEALVRVNCTSSCVCLSLIPIKVLYRVHFANSRLSRLFPCTSDTCTSDRCGSSLADHTHVFFLVQKINEFWPCFFNVRQSPQHYTRTLPPDSHLWCSPYTSQSH